MIKIHIKYISKLWSYLQKLMRSGGEGYLLVGKFFVAVLLVMGSVKVGIGQEIKALKSGESIPDFVWEMPMELEYFNGKKEKVHLSDYKGKVIVFDFWSTGCKSCIEGIPKLELIQERFKNNLVVIMVNSKRNRDTAERIAKRFQKYKKDFNYTPSLATITDDTVFTILFKHNVLPTVAVINSKGEFVATTGANNLTDRNIESWIQGANGNIKNTGYYINVGDEGRGGGGPLFDTINTYQYSVFAKQRDHFLDSYPNFIYRNGTTYLRIGNQTLSFLLNYAFPFEMQGYDAQSAFYEAGLGIEFKLDLINNNKDESRYWYEFFSRDSVSKMAFRKLYTKDFTQYFKIAVERRKDTVEFYTVSFKPEFDKIKTKSNIMISKASSVNNESYSQNIPIYNIISGLSYAFEVPIVIDRSEMTRVDMTIPAGFVFRSEKEKLDFFKERGIILTKVRAYKEYPYIYLSSNSYESIVFHTAF
ncbi:MULTISPECIES: TlpA family protein disulfide reductase [Sphingobacterium]|uniref:TlpA family protein disulfide reductase n=1 Tax=Sphingobacterium TaxID=28453 RepID=UPI0010D42C96|nr:MULTISPECIES: TlpA disulfide reductase family protein [Sphingobacterium]MCW2262099.1 thiol-disulfide isomerase/thioredoxin [Sphingobacterium kitahiroshimense]TCR13154.1 thiol-disulfide isomerase/thioredoxin [Sphingobacterium sp. JUb78]